VADTPAKGSQYQAEIVVNKDGVVGITWFDTRDDGPHHYNEYFTASLDGGKTFLPPQRVSSESSTPRGAGNAAFSIAGSSASENGVFTFLFSAANRWPSGGDYMGLSVDSSGIFHPFWIDSRSGTGQLWTAPVMVRHTIMPLPELQATDVTHNIVLAYDRATWDPAHNVIHLPIRIRNTSNVTLYPPFNVTVTATKLSLDDKRNAVVVENADNGMKGVGASLRYTRVLNGYQALAPGGITEARIWDLKLNPLTSQPSFNVNVKGFINAHS
jgi:hypothetical protein